MNNTKKSHFRIVHVRTDDVCRRNDDQIEPLPVVSNSPGLQNLSSFSSFFSFFLFPSIFSIISADPESFFFFPASVAARLAPLSVLDATATVTLLLNLKESRRFDSKL